MTLKRGLALLLLCCLTINSFSQQKPKQAPKKYNSIMWEISGNGLKKKAYLFGTMHVSNKLAFNLSDTFYNALKSVDAVAIENDPLTWQEEYNTSIFTRISNLYSAANNSETNSYITKNSFQFAELENEFKVALAIDPEVINHFLYRSFSASADFQEDTYLDMHIFQSGRKLGKKFIGLENFRESEALILKAIKAQSSESRRKSKSNETDEDEVDKTKSTGEKIEDAYRTGDLDLLDSLSKKEFRSEGFLEYFLYARNDIHAREIDKVLKSGLSLFAAVGAAHLPGKRGVIEQLRAKGYTLKPVIMGMQISKQRDEINKMTIPVTFSKQYAADSLFTVDVPGKLYNFSYASRNQNKQWVYADFSNGAYYMVTRLSTNGLLWGKTADDMHKKIDSMIYENIPGKILERTVITNNGYKGFNILNKTRKGDVQRYNIFLTPLELIVFKMSGFEEYVKGAEGSQFFNSIKMNKAENNWQTYIPSKGGFSIKLPHKPVEENNIGGNIYAMLGGAGATEHNTYEAYDEKTETYFNIFHKNVTNYSILEEDTFNLALACESLLSTSQFQTPQKRTQGNLNQIPYIEISGKCADNFNYTNRIFLSGNEYYAVITKYKKANNAVSDVLNSFAFEQLTANVKNNYADSSLKFTVSSSLAPDSITNEFINITRVAKKVNELDNKTSKSEEPYWAAKERMVFKNDTTHEEIVVESRPYPKYFFIKDTAEFWKGIFENVNSKIGNYSNQYDDFFIKEKKVTDVNNQKVYDIVFADTNCNQTITSRFILTNARLYTIYTLASSQHSMSSAKSDFFNSFRPMFDSATNYDVINSKGKLFFDDYFSKDSVTSKFARSNIEEVRFIEKDIPLLVNAITKLDANNKDYFKDKVALIKEISNLNLDTAMPTILYNLYNKAGDTATFQNACIAGLAKAKNKQAFKYLSEIVLNDPPVFENRQEVNTLFFDLRDTMQLAKSILPQLLPLVSLDDYKWAIYSTLAQGVDSNILAAADYESIFSKIYFDARIELKKMLASDEKLANKLKSNSDDETNDELPGPATYDNAYGGYSRGYNNVEDLETYGKLLMPFWDKNSNVVTFFNKFVASRNIEAKFAAAKLLINAKKPVADSVWRDIAKDEKYRVQLFDYLEKNKLENYLPSTVAKQQLFCKSLLQTGYNKKDSLVYLNVYLPATVKNKKGNVLFFKYKEDEKDVDWKIALCGLQPENLSKVSTDETIAEFTGKVLKTNKPLQDQLTKILKEQLYGLRKSSSRFFDGDGFDYKNMFNRYND